MKFLKKDRKPIIDLKKPHFKSFYYALSVFFVTVFLFSLLLSGGYSAKSILFLDNTDTFMDHFNSVIYNLEDPYENRVIYPPLATFVYNLCLKTIPESEISENITNAAAKAQPRTVKIPQGFLFQFILYALFSLILFLIAFDCTKKGDKKEKLLLLYCTIFSTPFLFMAERGNNLIIPLAFSMIFITYYDSKSKIRKEIALISLAIAVGFKLYPAVFAVLLLRKKEYKELIRTIIYCVCTTILPFFLFYNGFTSMSQMLTHIKGFSGKRSTASNLDAQLDFKRIAYFVMGLFRNFTGIIIPEGLQSTLASCFRYGATLLCAFGALFTEKKWKSVLLCGLIIYGFPGTCSTYVLIYIIPAVCLFLDEEKEASLKHYIYLALIALTQIPLFGINGTFTRYWPTKISSMAVFCLCIIVFCELIAHYAAWNTHRKDAHKPYLKTFHQSLKNKILSYIPCKKENTLSEEAVLQ